MSMTSKAGPQLEPGPPSTEGAGQRQTELPHGAGPGSTAPPSRLDHWPRPGSLSGAWFVPVPVSPGPQRQPQLTHAWLGTGLGHVGPGTGCPAPLNPFPQCRQAVHSRVTGQLPVLQQGAIVTHLEGGMASVHLLRPHVHTGPLPSANPSGIFQSGEPLGRTQHPPVPCLRPAEGLTVGAHPPCGGLLHPISRAG